MFHKTKMAHNVQYPLKICEIHDQKEVFAYCNTCKRKICSSCIKGDHTAHDWDLIVEILKEKRRHLPKECEEIRAKQLPILRKEIDVFDRKIQNEEADFEKNKTTLIKSRNYNVDKIKNAFDERVNECHQNSEAAKKVYREGRDALKGKVGYLEKMTTSLDKDIDTLPDHDIIDMEQEMKDELQIALSYSADKYMSFTSFVPGELDPQALNGMIGCVHNVSLRELNEANKFSSYIRSIEAVADDKAFVRLDDDRYARLISKCGEDLKVLKTPCSDLIIFSTGEIILTDFNKVAVSVLSKDENLIRTFDTKPLHPLRICKTEDNHILVTLKDGGEWYNLVQTSRRIVQRMTLTGKVVHTFEFKEDGKTRLFTYPTRMAENMNTDVCVVNNLSDDSGELVVLHRDGRVRFIYKGDGLSSETFRPRDVECDPKCRILLTEYYSKAIYMLSDEGMYLCKLCQYEKINPYVLSIYGDTLWCGFSQGNVKVFQYVT